MGSQEDHQLIEQKEELIDGVTSLLGYQPPGVRVLLRVLAHPSLVHLTRQYFSAQDVSLKCLTYESPWSCSKEAEAKYENIKYGWLGGANGVGFDESWCDNCRKKVMGDE